MSSNASPSSAFMYRSTMSMEAVRWDDLWHCNGRVFMSIAPKKQLIVTSVYLNITAILTILFCCYPLHRPVSNVFTDFSMCPWLVMFAFVAAITIATDIVAFWIAFSDPGVIRTPRDRIAYPSVDNNYHNQNNNAPKDIAVHEGYEAMESPSPPQQREDEEDSIHVGRRSTVENNNNNSEFVEGDDSNRNSFEFESAFQEHVANGLQGIIPEQKSDWIAHDFIPRDMSYCAICDMYRPRRAKHCRACSCCVEDFDHHCPWLSNCIGKRNYKQFIVLLVCLSLFSGVTGSICVYQLVAFFIHNSGALRHQAPFVWIQFIGRVFISVTTLWIFGAVVFLLGYHFFLISIAQTTYEHVSSFHVSFIIGG
eukprot:TRINITY_DN2788_c0_g1_i2.p1 TRINITY_DN2788_c0_g1~~TRINITY_DN2788_c0_g1_i2.p1  ORF type:complete len:366 (-),score=57.18 TRINITY_DN2788_c0_g1_i2:720-1817(-)